MSENIHEKVQRLLAELLVEGIPASTQAWLEEHLRTCEECAREAETLRGLLRALCSVPVAVPLGMVERTQLRVRLRSQENAAGSQSGSVLWLLTGMSWLLGILSAPLIWRVFAWVGSELRVPKIALELGFVLWWAVPALFAIGIVLHQRAAGSQRRIGF